ncbi:TetR/AcrR family transcriptional regulator [Aquimarina intermedia]|uniref:TetR family transcriptional regulator n=1 Tax=Aquimarina intermedia TaxID=350814 RepID=A0A5S5C2W7_9FLAO|nr:TetR/AcrR family transcriptional regulator [Aquimarina intermedia]TYP73654.1 TetR family transcriptional regulator [Aquimarina intermedia]
MERLSLHITISPELYTKDPDSSVLGRKIISKGIEMINELGFESFTFKKLGVAIGSNESSVYRYFSSKHALLVYLISWYWSWIEYKLVFATTNVTDPKVRLHEAIILLTQDVTEDHSFSYINEILLYQIIISESTKAYYTKDIDAENEKGYYKTYKRVVQRVSELVLNVNPAFEFPHMLVSTVIEGAHHQRYFSKHLPTLTDIKEGENYIVRFYTELVQKTIQ